MDIRTDNDIIASGIEMCTEIRRMSRALTRLFDERMPEVPVLRGRTTHLRVTQLTILRALNDNCWLGNGYYKHKDITEGAYQSDLAKMLGVDGTTLSRNLKVLINDNGWVEVKNFSSSAKERWLILTDNGRKTLQLALPICDELHKLMAPALRSRRHSFEKALSSSRAVTEAVEKVRTQLHK